MSVPPFRFPRTIILGYGLIGASLAKALRAHRLADQIIAFDADEAALKAGVAEKILSGSAFSVETLLPQLKGADLVVFCLPPETTLKVAASVGAHIGPEALVMDVCSVKHVVAGGLRGHLAHPARYIPAHPIAGAATAGQAGSKADLFKGRPVMLTPEQGIEITDPALLAARAMWEHLGASVTLMPAEVHDLVYAYVSHLPQALAFVAAPAVLRTAPAEQFAEHPILSRFLRLGQSPAALWTDIFTMNAPMLSQAIATALAMMEHFAKELREGFSQDQKEEAQAIEAAELFARVVSSCLVMTVYQLEHQSGMKLASYAGAGFADMAAAAIEAPEPDIERISKSYQQVLAMLDPAIAELQVLLEHLQLQQTGMLRSQLENLANNRALKN